MPMITQLSAEYSLLDLPPVPSSSDVEVLERTSFPNRLFSAPHRLVISMPTSQGAFNALYLSSLVPLHACLVGFSWVVYDFFQTIGEEVRYIWPQRKSFAKFMFLWIRYYTIALVLFDVLQIHIFSRPGIPTNAICIAFDPITRIAGAISLWSVEIIMQLRIYAIFKCSKKIATFNIVLFLISIGGFLWILIYNTRLRGSLIADAIHLPLPGCPTINGGIEWALWVPATCYEGVLFSFALYKGVQNNMKTLTCGSIKETKISLFNLLIRDNILYFLTVAGLLVFNNLMVVGLTHIPWFSYGPFHAAVGITTVRMLLNLRRFTLTQDVGSYELADASQPPAFMSMNFAGRKSTTNVGEILTAP